MNCTDCERLFDAYLDGQLSGSLRLEFDAHRLRCRHCQQTLAMMEAAGAVVASDRRAPRPPEDFTDQVMARIASRQSKRAERNRRGRAARRWMWPTGVIVNAAALLAIVVWVYGLRDNAPPPLQTASESTGVPAVAGVDPRAGFDEVYDYILNQVEGKISALQAVGVAFPADMMRLAQLANVTLPDDVAAASVGVLDDDPLRGLSELLFPSAPEPISVEPAATDQHTL